MSESKVNINDSASGKSLHLDVHTGSCGDPVLDISALHKNLGYFTYDPGFSVTASCSSEITFIDGEQGILRYRGYPIEQLCEHSSYIEVAYLLLYGELPSPAEFRSFEHDITHHTMVHDKLNTFLKGFRYDSHPMAIMAGVVASLAGFYHDDLDIKDAEERDLTAKRLIAKMPTIAAAAYRHHVGWPTAYPRNSLNYTERFLDMMFSVPAEPYKINPVAARALDLLFILHADHEQNASTSTVRLVASTGANPYACVSAGISALWGPAHGGANEAVLAMLSEIGSVEHVGKYIDKAKDKDDPFRLMGFGHRVYKNFDPRAKIIRQACHDVLDDLGVTDPLLDLAMKLEKIALEDDYFVERKLYPNVDFYSGIIYKALNIPTSMFTAMFAIARTSGWVAQWLEQSAQGGRIGRPRQLYTGYAERDYLPIGKR